jgi:polyhydroxyalkanoate synthase
MLRANDLIWSFVVNNYLLGKDPMPFDLLYWNSDSTRMPAELHSFYLRNMYMDNKLAQPGGITMGGVPIDLRKIKTPIFMQAGREDHIAPFRSVFKGVHHFSGPTEFMLAGSGHIAGVINPPEAKKYQYWVNPDGPKDVDAWLEGAEEHPGSWWPYWHKWLSAKSGKKVPARVPGDGKLEVIEDAPGSYVKVK